MGQANYPYLDLSVLPEIRNHVIAPNAAVLFSADLERVLWANGEGASLIGSPAIRRALEGSIEVNPATMRQIEMAVDRLADSDSSTAIMRMRGGYKTRLLGFTVCPINLPKGEAAILLVTESLHGRSHGFDDMARVAVDCLDGYSHASAILDDQGGIIAASEHFSKLNVANSALSKLVSEVSTEDDRLVKRLIETVAEDLPAGIARLSDQPASHLLVIAGNTDAIARPALREAPEREAPQQNDTLIDEVADPYEPVEEAIEPQIEATPEEPAPVIGAFSNRRAPSPDSASVNRWYYKTPRQSDALSSDGLENNTEDPRHSDPADSAEYAEDTEDNARNETAFETAQFEDLTTGEMVDQVVSEEEVSVSGPEFIFQGDQKPVRFIWEMDTEQRFVSVSDEFSEAVGSQAADIVGKTWDEVSSALKIQNAADVRALLEKGDTWSGKTVLWPIENTPLLVPIDLAGLPSYGRNRSFEGFNGFGIVRTADVVPDPQSRGTQFGTADSTTDNDEKDEKPAIGFLTEATRKVSNDDTPPESSSRIVDLQDRRSVMAERALSDDEKEAFEEIAEKLSDDAANDSADTLKRPSSSSDQQTKDDDRENKEEAPERADFIPSAFAGASSRRDTSQPAPSISEQASSPSSPSLIDTTPPSYPSPDNDKPAATPVELKGPSASEVDTSILARLPIPVLVYRENNLLFANSDFFGLTGYETLQILDDAGGLEALFGSRQFSGDETAQVYHRNGERLDVQVHLQRVPWDNERAMLLTLRKSDGGNSDNTPGESGSGSDPTGDTRPGVLIGRDQSSPTHGTPPIMKSPPSAPRLATVTPLHPPTSAPPSRSSDGSRQVEAFGGLGPEDLRSILDTATDGVVVLSDDGNVLALNKSAEALFDVESSKMAGKPFVSLLAPESHRSAMDYLSGITGPGVASLLNDGREIIGKTIKGGLIPLFLTIGRLDKTGTCCAVMRDITQWKKAEEELLTAKAQAETTSQQKTNFLAQVSHEIRTPLNAIIGFSDLMIEERFGQIENDRYRGYLRDIKRSGSHVLDLVNELLDISKIEAGKMDLDFDACDLNTLVSETVALTQPNANKQRVIIRTSLSAMVPKVVADPRSLRQIVLNLVSNSIKYTKSGGQVIVSTVYEETGEVVLRVRDTGVGMSDSDLVRALEPFQQVGTSHDREKQGTGLGLPLTKAMVEANRANFHIESKPDDGTLVEIHFPIQRVLADR